MAYHVSPVARGVSVALTGQTVDDLFGSAALAVTELVTGLDTVEPRRPEEVDIEAPELDPLLVDFVTELLYRFDTRGWLTRVADVVVRQANGVWTLEGTLTGERFDAARHVVKSAIKGVTYQGLKIRREGDAWLATIHFDR